MLPETGSGGSDRSAPPDAGIDWDGILERRVLPALGVRRGGVDNPAWVMVAGQQGSGKSGTVGRLIRDLGAEQTQVLSADEHWHLLPELHDSAGNRIDKAAQAAFVEGVQSRWTDRLTERALDLGAHIVQELPFPHTGRERALLLRQVGYRTGLRLLTTSPEISWPATVLRYLDTRDGPWRATRAISRARHDQACDEWVLFAARLETEAAFDEITVLRRDGAVAFENRLQPVDAAAPDGPQVWAAPAFALESLLIERAHALPRAELVAAREAWLAVMAAPALVLNNHCGVSHADLTDQLRRYEALLADPVAGFDLADAACRADRALAGRWLAARKAEAARILALPGAAAIKGLEDRLTRYLGLLARLLELSG